MDSLDAEPAPKSEEVMRKDCAAFVTLIDELGIDATQNWNAEQLGHDLWLTRNGHGAGFWDRGHDEETRYQMPPAAWGSAICILETMGQSIYESPLMRLEATSRNPARGMANATL